MSRPADLAIWGRVPPPIGGMSVHIERLLPHLERAGITVQMYSVGRPTPPHPQVEEVSHRRLRWLASRMGSAGEPVHYVFSDDTRARFAAACLAAFAGRAVILRVGGRSLARALESPSRTERAMIRFAMRHATVVVGVSEEICQLALSAGARRVCQIAGFIPPEANGTLPHPDVQSFINGGVGPVVLGAGEVWARQDVDLYGAYDFMDLLEAIPELRAVYYAYEISPLGEQPRADWIREIRRRGLEDRMFAHISTESLWPAMPLSDLMLRPSRSDGDSNAVREALSLGLPVVASDCVARPEPTVVYPTGDTAAMIASVRSALQKLPDLSNQTRQAQMPDNAAPIVALITELLHSGSGAR